jgi:hypothetical protein
VFTHTPAPPPLRRNRRSEEDKKKELGDEAFARHAGRSQPLVVLEMVARECAMYARQRRAPPPAAAGQAPAKARGVCLPARAG